MSPGFRNVDCGMLGMGELYGCPTTLSACAVWTMRYQLKHTRMCLSHASCYRALADPIKASCDRPYLQSDLVHSNESVSDRGRSIQQPTCRASLLTCLDWLVVLVSYKKQ